MTKEQDPLNLDLWEFYVLPTKILDEKKKAQKTITLPSLLQLNPIRCNYDELENTINIALNA